MAFNLSLFSGLRSDSTVPAGSLLKAVWGMSLLTVLTYILARHRKVSAMSEVGKHLAVATVIIFLSKSIGHWVTAHVT
jgi:hypothetical protein